MCRRRSARRSSTRSPHRGRGCSTSGAGPDELGAHSWRPMMTTLPSISRSACCASLRVGAIRLALVRRFCRPTGGVCRFAMHAFDAVLLIQVVGAAEGWQALVKEARRVLRPAGALVIGRAVAPESGIDAQMKHRLAMVLQDLGVPSHQTKSRAVLQRCVGDGGAHHYESSRRHMGRRAFARHVSCPVRERVRGFHVCRQPCRQRHWAT